MSPISIMMVALCGVGLALGGLVSPHGYGLEHYHHYPSLYKAPAYSYANVYKVNHKPIPVVYTKPLVYKTVIPSYHGGYYPSYLDYSSHHYPHYPSYYH